MYEKKLDELENKAKEIDATIAELEGQLEDFYASEAYEMYQRYPDPIREITYPKEHKTCKQIEENKSKKQELAEEIGKLAVELNEELGQKISDNEKHIEAYEKNAVQLEEEIARLQSEIEQLKGSESYKEGDIDTLLKVENLEDSLNAKVSLKEKRVAEVKKLKSEVEQLKVQKEELIATYDIKEKENVVLEQSPEQNKDEGVEGEQIETQPQTPETPEEPTPETQEEQTVAENVVNFNNNRQNNNNMQYNYEEQVPEVPSPQDNTKDLKKEFYELTQKANKGKLSEQDFTRLAEIMSDKSNYDKLDITTGRIFNNSKGIFKAMAKYVTQTGTTIKEAKSKEHGFGIDIEHEDEEGKFLSSADVQGWSGLKKIAQNSEKKIDTEEFLKKIADLDREQLDGDEQRAIYDDAKAHLSRFEALRGALATYAEVVELRKEPKNKWFERKNKIPLPEGVVVEQTNNNLEEPNESVSVEPEQPTESGKVAELDDEIIKNNRLDDEIVFHLDDDPPSAKRSSLGDDLSWLVNDEIIIEDISSTRDDQEIVLSAKGDASREEI